MGILVVLLFQKPISCAIEEAMRKPLEWLTPALLTSTAEQAEPIQRSENEARPRLAYTHPHTNHRKTQSRAKTVCHGNKDKLRHISRLGQVDAGSDRVCLRQT